MATQTEIIISAKDETRQAFESVKGSLTRISGLAANLGFVGLAGTAASIISMVKSTADFADEMSKAAQKAGVTTEALSGLKYAADLSDVSFEGLQTGLKKLNVNLNEAANGSKSSVDTFNQLGISIRDASGNLKSADVILSQVSDVFQNLPDGPQKAALAVQLFGKAGSDLIPLLNGGSQGIAQLTKEAEKFGLVIDSKTAAAAEQFNDNMTRLQASAQGVAINIGSTLLPAMTHITDAMAEAALKGGVLSAIWAGLVDASKISLGIIDTSSLDNQLIKAQQALKSVTDARNEVSDSSAKDILTRLDKRVTDAQAVVTSLNAQIKARDDADAARKKNSGPNELPVQSSGTTKKDPDIEAAKRFIESLQKQTETMGLSRAEILEYDAANLKLSASQRKLAESFIGTQKGIENQKEAAAEYVEQFEKQQKILQEVADFNQKIAQDAAKIAGDKQDAYTSEADSIRKANEDLNVDLITNDKARAQAQIDLEHERTLERINGLGLEVEQAQALIDQETEHYQLQQKKVEQGLGKSKNLTNELGLTFTSAFESAVVGNEKFSKVLDGLAQDIERVILRITVIEPLLKAIKDSVGDLGLGDIASSIFGGGSSGYDPLPSFVPASANGNVFSGGNIVPFAKGGAFKNGVVDSPTLFNMGLMGEAGPEAIVPLSRGADGKLGVKASGMGDGAGVNVQVNLIETSDKSKQGTVQNNSNQDGTKSITIFIESIIDNKLNNDIGRGRGVADVFEQTYGLNRAAGARG